MATFNTSVAASSDDARQSGGSGTMNLTGSTINSGATNTWIGLRFTNVTIPAGSTINSAYISVRTTTEDDPDLDIYGEDTDDAATFTTTNNDISGRTLTTAKVNWTATNIGTATWCNSPDIATVIQEIIDRAGWSSGNDIAIILDTLSASGMIIRAYDGGTGDYPSITIDYTAPSSGSNPKTARIRLTTKVGGTLA